MGFRNPWVPSPSTGPPVPWSFMHNREEFLGTGTGNEDVRIRQRRNRSRNTG
jgi:hypothetical protein